MRYGAVSHVTAIMSSHPGDHPTEWIGALQEPTVLINKAGCENGIYQVLEYLNYLLALPFTIVVLLTSPDLVAHVQHVVGAAALYHP